MNIQPFESNQLVQNNEKISINHNLQDQQEEEEEQNEQKDLVEQQCQVNQDLIQTQVQRKKNQGQQIILNINAIPEEEDEKYNYTRQQYQNFGIQNNEVYKQDIQIPEQQKSSQNEDDLDDQIVPLYLQSKDCDFIDFKVVGVLHGVHDYQEEEEIENQRENKQTSSIKMDIQNMIALQRQYYQYFGFINLNTQKYQVYQNNSYNFQLLTISFPFIQINIKHHPNFEQALPNKILTNRGIFQSPKQTNCQDIIIGRGFKLQQKGEVFETNDIIIEDQELSRFHCKLITKYYYGEEKLPIISTLNSLFSYYDQKYSIQKKNNQKLDSIILALVQPKIKQILQQFLKEKPSLYLVDLNSINGTQIMIDHKEHTRLSVNQIIQIGLTHMRVLEVNDVRYYDSFSDILTEAFDNQYIGLPEEYQRLLEIGQQILFQQAEKNWQHESMNIFYKQKIKQLLKNEMKSKHIKELEMIPYIKLTFGEYNESKKRQENKNYYLFYNKDQPTVFQVGRSNLCQINLQSSMVSRIHCEIEYDPKLTQWKIRDGFSIEGIRYCSSHQTWISLCNYQRMGYLESIPYELKLDDIIKVGDYCLQMQTKQFNYSFL